MAEAAETTVTPETAVSTPAAPAPHVHRHVHQHGLGAEGGAGFVGYAAAFLAGWFLGPVIANAVKKL